MMRQFDQFDQKKYGRLKTLYQTFWSYGSQMSSHGIELRNISRAQTTGIPLVMIIYNLRNYNGFI